LPMPPQSAPPKRRHRNDGHGSGSNCRGSSSSGTARSGNNNNSSYGQNHSSSAVDLWRSGDGSLLHPRLIVESSSPLAAARLDYSGSQSSLNESKSSSLSSLDPNCFAFARADSTTSTVLTLPAHGVSLSIPENALEPGFDEEVFLTVLRAARDRPRLSRGQTLLGPVVAVGPPGLLLRAPVVLSVQHCADESDANWELGVYHCDSPLFAENDAPWVKAATVNGPDLPGQSVIAVTSDRAGVCHVVTEKLSRFCLVGQSAANGSDGAAKQAKILTFGKQTTNGDFNVSLSAAEATKSSVDLAAKRMLKQGFNLLARPASISVRDGQADLSVIASDCTSGWALMGGKTLNYAISFDDLWSSAQNKPARVDFSVRHVDPTVSRLALKITASQDSTAAIDIDLDASVPIGSGLESLEEEDLTPMLPLIPSPERAVLCSMLDRPPPGLNDWRALCAALRLERHSTFLSVKMSPSSTALALWEALAAWKCADSASPLADLAALLRLIGREDCASIVEGVSY